MNNACLLAACAVNTHKRKTYNQRLDKDFNLYYKIKLKKYYHFEAIKVATIVENPHSTFLDKHIVPTAVMFKPVQVEPKSIGIEKIFTVCSKNCPNGIDKYVEDNLNKYTELGIWYQSDRDAVYTYIDEIKRKYNTDLEPDSLRYTTQFCWEITLAEC